MILNRARSGREIPTKDEECPYEVGNFVFQEVPKLGCSVICTVHNICQSWSHEAFIAYNGIGFHVCDF